MSDKSSDAAVELHDIAAAFSLLTRLRVPVDHARAGARAGAAVWAYPVVGAIVGLVSGFAGLLLAWLGVDMGISAVVVLSVAMLLTGALHEDGIADCADGLAGGITPARRLEIMKDSRIGAFGAATLGAVLLARWSGTEALLPLHWPTLFAAIGAASRLPMVLAMMWMPLASSVGLAAGVGKPPVLSVAISISLSVVFCLLFLGLNGLILLTFACLAPIPLWFVARRAIGGYTGDILGGSQQIAEIAALGVATAVI